jgi:putative ABC transport system substrate-binding protein
MRRREFVTLVGGAAVAWPLTARAQWMRRIGVLMATAEDDPEGQSRLTVVQDKLREFGWSDERNIRFDVRWASGDANRLRTFAAELVALMPDAVLADATPATASLLRETRILPIVFARVADPVGQGFVVNLARPGGNVTGFTNIEPALAGKWLGLLKELLPNIARVAFMYNPETAPYSKAFVQSLDAAARATAVKAIDAPVRSPADIEAFIEAHARQAGGGVIVAGRRIHVESARCHHCGGGAIPVADNLPGPQLHP